MVAEAVIWFILGLAVLVAGAEWLVRSVSRLASWLGISRLIIGLTVVAFGTSSPELAVSIQSGLTGQTDILLGNVVGSNIANILLILGVSSLILPLRVHSKLVRVDVPVMIGITLLLYIFAWSGVISFIECLMLTGLLILYMMFLIRENGKENIPDEPEGTPKDSVFLLVLGILGGLTGLVLGSRWLVSSAVIFAEMAGISELIIGLTVVSIGTSLPEVVTAVVAALKRERDIAVGSIVGSNILNILVVLGIAGLFSSVPITVQPALLRFDLLILIAASIACLPIFFTGHKISRWEGALFLTMFICYIGFLFLASVQHEAVGLFSGAMLLFVLPITAITISIISYREWKRRRRIKKLSLEKI